MALNVRSPGSLRSQAVKAKKREHPRDLLPPGSPSLLTFLDGRWIVSGSDDKTMRIWNVATGEAIGQPLRQNDSVYSVAFSPDNKRIVSDMGDKTLQIWDGMTAKALGSPLRGHTGWVRCVAFSPDGQRIVSGSDDRTVRTWDGMTGEAIGRSLQGHTDIVHSVAWSPDGKRIVSGSEDMTIRIWDSETGKELCSPLVGHTHYVWCVAVSADGRRIVSGSVDKTLRMWDAETGKAIGQPLKGHTHHVYAVAFSPDGTLIVSGSGDKTIRVWDGETGEAIGSPIQAHDRYVMCVTFSPDGNRIASGSNDQTVKLWDSATIEAISLAKLPQFTIKIDDDPSVLENVSEAIAHCKQGEFDAAMQKFDFAIAVSSSSPKSAPSICAILVIKAITLFEGGSEQTGIARVNNLIRLSAKNSGFQMVKAYMLNKLAHKAFEHGLYDRAIELLYQGISGNLLCTMDTYCKYRAKIPADQGLALVTTLFGWEFETLRYKIKQSLCEALRRLGRHQDALDAVENMGQKLTHDEQDKYKEWSTCFKQDCAKEWSAKGDQALQDGDYDVAVEQYSGSIALDPSNYNLYSNRSSAYVSKQLWIEALDDAEQAIKLDPSLAPAYQQKYYALHGAERYDEAIVALRLFVGKSNTDSNSTYPSPDATEAKLKAVASDTIKNMPTRVFDTTSGILCNHGDILRTFQTSKPYKKLVSSITTREELDRGDSITNLVDSYFRYTMLSHRWEDAEILLQHIREGESVHAMKPDSPGLVKLQKLCTISSDLGILWAWCDTCCIDKKDAVELQESIASMNLWYSKSAVTIIYLSDVEKSSAKFTSSKWFTRGWTLQELLAPSIIMFYKRDWSLFWDKEKEKDDEDGDTMPHDVALINHKGCDEILYMIEQATEIDVETLRGFQPGMEDTRQKLRWASRRQTTKQEDTAYSLFGLFGIHLPIIYGEKEQALGRLLQEIVGQTGELAVLDWVGQPSKMHSCLPIDISCFQATQWTPPPLDDTVLAAHVSALRNSLLPEEIAKLAAVHRQIQNLPAPRFQYKRLRLPCITYNVKVVTQQQPSQMGHDSNVRNYNITATGLKAFSIRTTEMMSQGSEARPTHQKYVIAHIVRDDLLERLMEVPEDEATGILEMVVNLSRPFLALVLVQCGRFYQRIAALDDITTEVEDMLAVRAEGLKVTTLEVV